MPNKMAVTVYVEPEMYDFIDAIRWGAHNSKTEQMELMFQDWKKQWIKEHGGEEAIETMKKWAKEAEEKVMMKKQRKQKHPDNK